MQGRWYSLREKTRGVIMRWIPNYTEAKEFLGNWKKEFPKDDVYLIHVPPETKEDMDDLIY